MTIALVLRESFVSYLYYDREARFVPRALIREGCISNISSPDCHPSGTRLTIRESQRKAFRVWYEADTAQNAGTCEYPVNAGGPGVRADDIVRGSLKLLPGDEEIQKAYVDGAKPSSGPIHILDYDPEWPRQYAREADAVRSVLGEGVVQLEHVGSTSVPGLPAKPIIDMLLVVANSADELAYVPAMEAAGYVLRIREPDWFQHRLFKGPRSDINLHVFSKGCEEIGRMLAFRDWLRDNAADRELYARTKRELAKKEWKYVQHYADAKTEVVREILKRALEAR